MSDKEDGEERKFSLTLSEVGEGESSNSDIPPAMPSPSKRVEEIEGMLATCKSPEEKIIALAKIMKKERKKLKTVKKALVDEIEKHQKTRENLAQSRAELTKLIEDGREKEEKLV